MSDNIELKNENEIVADGGSKKKFKLNKKSASAKKNAAAKPKGSKKEYISIDFGDYDCKVVVGSFIRNKFKITNKFQVEYEEKLCNDGVIADYELLRVKMNEAFVLNKVNVKKQKDTVFTVNCSDLMFRSFTVPKVQEKYLDNVIRMEIDNQFPTSKVELNLSYKVVSELEENGEELYLIHVYSMPKKVVEPFYNLLVDLGLKPRKMDVSPNAIGTFLKTIIEHSDDDYTYAEKSDKTIALIDINRTVLAVNIYKNGELYFNRFLHSKPVMDSIHLLSSLTLEEIENSEDSEQLRANISEFANEIELVFKYYKARNNKNKIDEYFIFGDCVKNRLLLDELNSLMNESVSIISCVNGMLDSDDNITPYVNAVANLLNN